MLSEVGAIERDVVIGMRKPSRISDDRCPNIESLKLWNPWEGYLGFETRSTWDLKKVLFTTREFSR